MVSASYEDEALERSRVAIRQGALQPLNTHCEAAGSTGDDNFELRRLTARLPKHLRTSGPKENPFLPWDQRLEVSAIGDDHALILNKYPVQLGHMLLVTRQWASQTDWLEAGDFSALASVDEVTSGLWFFNSGPDAGASQPHRHLQLLPRRAEAVICPRESWFERRLQGLKPGQGEPPTPVEQASRVRRRHQGVEQDTHLLELYRSLAEELDIGNPDHDSKPAGPYNLLLTPGWMAMIRRASDGSHGFSVNALGFAGYLLATDDSDLQWLSREGPERLLASVVHH